MSNGAQLSMIEPEKLYSLSEIERLTGLKKSAIRNARMRGLQVRYFSRLGYVKGSDLLAYIVENSRDEKTIPADAAARNNRSLASAR